MQIEPETSEYPHDEERALLELMSLAEQDIYNGNTLLPEETLVQVQKQLENAQQLLIDYSLLSR